MDTSDQPPPYDTVETASGRLIILSPEGEVIPATGCIDLIGEAFSQDAAWVAVPQSRLGDDFFRLRTGVAGEIVQKFANYRIGLVILGDISRYTDASPTLSDFVREANAGRQLWFLRDRAELDGRLDRVGVSRQ